MYPEMGPRVQDAPHRGSVQPPEPICAGALKYSGAAVPSSPARVSRGTGRFDRRVDRPPVGQDAGARLGQAAGTREERASESASGGEEDSPRERTARSLRSRPVGPPRTLSSGIDSWVAYAGTLGDRFRAGRTEERRLQAVGPGRVGAPRMWTATAGLAAEERTRRPSPRNRGPAGGRPADAMPAA